ncbi:UDP-glycosyltransferase TURAN [Melia azedarach]|uniref:UDP-glycosyltransferase TURAN n=1 Tax=Melia azedarach TaxID=155640 RepID=A0ACC1XYQ7_MELAZ|nr:UDP-glycosyltransferase TURAN [Melia azedarach]
MLVGRLAHDNTVGTVSRKETTRSDLTISAPPMKSSCKSFKQISKWSSPAPAILLMYSPDSSMLILLLSWY